MCSLYFSKCVEHVLSTLTLSTFSLLAQARHILSSVQEFTTTQDTSTTLNEEISSLTLENKSLHSRLAELQQQYGMQMTEVVLELSDTRKEMVCSIYSQ